MSEKEYYIYSIKRKVVNCTKYFHQYHMHVRIYIFCDLTLIDVHFFFA